MAHRHQKAGQYGKSEAGKRARRIILILLIFALVAGACLGFAIGLAFRFPKSYLMLIPSIATLSIAYFGMKRADPYIDELSKQRLFFLRGGQAEGLIAWLLEDLDDNWHIFNGIKLDPESDIDHVLLGPAGIFCISTKSMRGLFSRTPSGLLHNGNSCEYDRQVLAQSAELKKKLDVVMGTPVRWVQAVLAVPFGFTQGDSMGNKYWLVHQENLLQTIAPDPLPKYRRNLDSQQIERIAKALEMLQVSAADVYERPKIPVK